MTRIGKALMVAALLLAGSTAGLAEFYQYVDRQGTVHFVDDPGSIPPEYRQQRKVYQERADEVSGDELQEANRQRQERTRQENEESLQRRAKKRELEARQANFTRIAVQGNTVFVPVTFVQNYSEVPAVLILDTGATTTLISTDLAKRLNIDQTKGIRIGVAGAKVVAAKEATVDAMRVGPHEATGLRVVIAEHRGGDGLLGMDFLRNVKFAIDYDKQVIYWQ